MINKATPDRVGNELAGYVRRIAKSATVSGSVTGSASSILTGGAATQTNAGTYAVTANFTPTDTINYESLTAASAGNFIINKTTLTITASNGSKTYRADFLHLPAVNLPRRALAAGTRYNKCHSRKCRSTPASADLAGSPYSIVPSAAVFGSGSAGNYNIAYANGTLTVGSATLIVTANDASKAYGSENPALAATYGGYVNGENSSAITGTPSLSTAATATSPVGNLHDNSGPGYALGCQITHSPLSTARCPLHRQQLQIFM